jgi:hypothetical protein
MTESATGIAGPVVDPQLSGPKHPKYDPRTGRIWEPPVNEEAEGPPAEMPPDARVTGRKLLGDDPTDTLGAVLVARQQGRRRAGQPR